MKLDYERMSSQLIRALRGSRSQVALSRRLGYASNAVYTWESGRRWPTAAVFLGLAERVGIDLDEAVRQFHGGEPSWLEGTGLSTPAGVATWLTDLKGNTPLVQVAERAGRSRFAVSRWLSGRAEPRLPDLLRLVQAASLRVLDFVALFADPAELRATRLAWRRLETARSMAWSSPWAQAVLLGLELRTYEELPAHDEAWLAHRLGLEVDEITASLTLLRETGQVRWTGTHYERVEVQAVDVRRPSRGSSLKEHWAATGLQRLQSGAPGLFSYNLFTVSDADLVRLEELHRSHYRAIRALIADSSPAERVVLVNLQVVPLDQSAPPAPPSSGSHGPLPRVV